MFFSDILTNLKSFSFKDNHICNDYHITLPVENYKQCRLCLISDSIKTFENCYNSYLKNGDLNNLYNSDQFKKYFENVINSFQLFLNDLNKDFLSLNYVNSFKKVQKLKNDGDIRSLVLLILDSTNNFNFDKQYNRSSIKSFRKRLIDNYSFVLEYFLNLKKDYLRDDFINDVFNYIINVLSNYESFYNKYLKSFDNYYNGDDANYDNAYDYYLNNDKKIIELKKYLYRCIYLIAYNYLKVLPNKQKR